MAGDPDLFMEQVTLRPKGIDEAISPVLGKLSIDSRVVVSLVKISTLRRKFQTWTTRCSGNLCIDGRCFCNRGRRNRYAYQGSSYGGR